MIFLTRKAMVKLWRQMLVLLEILNAVKADYDRYLTEAPSLGPGGTKTRHRELWCMKSVQLTNSEVPLGFRFWTASPARADSPHVVITLASDCRSVLARIEKILLNHPTFHIVEYGDRLHEGDTGKWYLEFLVFGLPSATLHAKYIDLPEPPEERKDAGHQPERA